MHLQSPIRFPEEQLNTCGRLEQDGSSGKILTFNPEGFVSNLDRDTSYIELFSRYFYLTRCSQTPGTATVNWTKGTSFHVLTNSQFTHRCTIRHYTVSVSAGGTQTVNRAVRTGMCIPGKHCLQLTCQDNENITEWRTFCTHCSMTHILHSLQYDWHSPLTTVWLAFSTHCSMTDILHSLQYDWLSPLTAVWLAFSTHCSMTDILHSLEYDWHSPLTAVWLTFSTHCSMTDILHSLQYDWHSPLTTHHTQRTTEQQLRAILHVQPQHTKPTLKSQPRYRQDSDFWYNAHTKLKKTQPTKTVTQQTTQSTTHHKQTNKRTKPH
jgi:hypothetical protein